MTEGLCPVREHCNLKACEGPDGRYINQSNCTCLGCIQRGIKAEADEHGLTLTPEKSRELCEWSGDMYNTDGDCLGAQCR